MSLGSVTYYRRGPWRRFALRYGWRAYALPALAIFTMIVIADPNVVAKTTSAAPAKHVTHAKNTPAEHAAAQHAPAQQAPPQQFVLGTDSTPCTQNTTGRIILVSIRVQRAWMCNNKTQVYSTLVTTGAENVGDGTPLGTWHVQDKQTNRYLVGPGYRDFVKYWMPFDGDFGFHDASWQTMPYGSSGYKANGSHGCIHLPLPAMKWFFNWADTNTAVTIQA